MSGTVFRVVRIFSVVPERETPLTLSAQNPKIIRTSMGRRFLKPKNDMYCPIPAAIVAFPNTEETMYRITIAEDIFLLNPFAIIEKKAPVEGYLDDDHANDNMTQEAEIATISHARSELGPAIPAAIPGTTNMPEPMVPPTPRLTSSNVPSDFLYLFSVTTNL
ncbi:MAG: hypothetical protein PHH85_11470 [Candidatus Methanoperedens sp.]|nr:hypothetical protein [Candidatus Methanoperedens sp.]